MTPIKVGKDIFVFGGGGDMMTQDKHTEIWRVSMTCQRVIPYDSYGVTDTFIV